MKRPSEWKADDLAELVRDKVPESIDLDYKECAALDLTDGKKNEVSKDVAAFANSAGGTIVFGMVEDKATHLPLRIDAGYKPGPVNKEWLDQVINSRIKPRIDGVLINAIDLTGAADPPRNAFVVEIPQSSRAPHMAADHRYYKRFNFESVPMEDYEVRDVSRRLETPDLQIQFGQSGQLTFEGGQSAPFELTGRIRNESPAPAEHAVLHVYVDERVTIVDRGEFTSLGKAKAHAVGKEFSLTALQLNWGVPGKMPLFQDVNFALSQPPIQISVPNGEADYYIGWQVLAPRMRGRQGTYILSVVEMSATVSRVADES